MPVEPPKDETSQQAQEQGTGARATKVHAPLERSRFGGTERRRDRPHDDDAPVRRSDLSKGPEELLEKRTATIN